MMDETTSTLPICQVFARTGQATGRLKLFASHLEFTGGIAHSRDDVEPHSVHIAIAGIDRIQRSKPEHAQAAFKVVLSQQSNGRMSAIFHVYKSAADWTPSLEQCNEICDALQAVQLMDPAHIMYVPLKEKSWHLSLSGTLLGAENEVPSQPADADEDVALGDEERSAIRRGGFTISQWKQLPPQRQQQWLHPAAAPSRTRNPPSMVAVSSAPKDKGTSTQSAASSPSEVPPTQPLQMERDEGVATAYRGYSADTLPQAVRDKLPPDALPGVLYWASSAAPASACTSCLVMWDPNRECLGCPAEGAAKHEGENWMMWVIPVVSCVWGAMAMLSLPGKCHDIPRRLALERRRYFIATGEAFFDVLDRNDVPPYAGAQPDAGVVASCDDKTFGCGWSGLGFWDEDARRLQVERTDLAEFVRLGEPQASHTSLISFGWEGFAARLRHVRGTDVRVLSYLFAVERRIHGRRGRHGGASFGPRASVRTLRRNFFFLEAPEEAASIANRLIEAKRAVTESLPPERALQEICAVLCAKRAMYGRRV